MPLAFTQEDCLVLFIILVRSRKRLKRAGWCISLFLQSFSETHDTPKIMKGNFLQKEKQGKCLSKQECKPKCLLENVLLWK